MDNLSVQCRLGEFSPVMSRVKNRKGKKQQTVEENDENRQKRQMG